MSGVRVRRGRSAAIGVLAVMAGACPGAAADETHGDVNLPPLTPEEIQELGLESAPPSADTTAPGAQDVDAGQIPEDQDTGVPSPEEAEPEATPEPAEPAVPLAAVPVAGAPVAEAPPQPAPPPTPAAPAPAAPVASPVRRRTEPRRPTRTVTPPPIGRQAEPVRPQKPIRPVVPARSPATPVVVARARPPAPETAARGARMVRTGESLWSIAADRLGRGSSPAAIAMEVERLWQLNRDRIRTGSPDVLPAGISLLT